jgi:hypothetical protein
MNILIWQIVVAVATMLMLFLRWQSCCRHHRGPERRVVPVRREQRLPVPYVSRIDVQRHRAQIVSARTVALSTLPMPIRGTVEAAEPVGPGDLRFAPPDVALMRRVVEGLRALPDSPRNTGA